MSGVRGLVLELWLSGFGGATRMDKPDITSVREIVARLGQRGGDASMVSVGDMVSEFGRRSHGPSLFLPALIGVSPLSGIPMVPAFLAIIIALFSLQILLGRDHLWLPDVITRRRIAGERVQHAMDRVTPTAQRMDRWFGGRLAHLTGPIGIRVAALVCLMLSFTVPFFEMVPFAGIIPMMAIAVFGLAITVRDGALMVGGLVLTTGAAVFLGPMVLG